MTCVTLRLSGLLFALVALTAPTAGRAATTTLTDSQILGQFNAVLALLGTGIAGVAGIRRCRRTGL